MAINKKWPEGKAQQIDIAAPIWPCWTRSRLWRFNLLVGGSRIFHLLAVGAVLGTCAFAYAPSSVHASTQPGKAMQRLALIGSGLHLRGTASHLSDAPSPSSTPVVPSPSTPISFTAVAANAPHSPVRTAALSTSCSGPESAAPGTVISIFDVSANGTPASTPCLASGTSYTLRISGVFVWGSCSLPYCPNGGPGFLRWGDAGYLSDDHWNSSSDPYWYSVVYLQVDGAHNSVGSYSGDHIYTVPVTGQGRAISLDIQDCGYCYGDNHGALRVEVIVGTSAPAAFALNVLPYQQHSMGGSIYDPAQWGGESMGEANSPGCGFGHTIENCGCMLASWVMLLDYYGAPHGFYTDPAVLNQWLQNPTDGGPAGYTGMNANPDRVKDYWNAQSIVDDQGNVLSLGQPHSATYTPQMLYNLLSQGIPVILQVAGHGTDEHHVVAVGATTAPDGQQTFYINDPFFASTNNPVPTLSQGWNNSATRMQWFNRPVASGEERYIAVAMASPADVIVTDPQGRRLGNDSESGQDYAEIPGGESDATAGTDVATGDQTVDIIKTLRIPTPSDGEYDIAVLGTGTGTYHLTVTAYDTGGALHTQTIEGPASPGSVVHYALTYASSSSEITLLQKVLPPTTTASATLGSGSTAYTFGAWTNQSVNVTLNATDNTGGSGVAHTYYAVDNAACTTSAVGSCTVYSGSPFTVSSAGTHTVTYFSVDTAGNVETANTVTVKIEATPPSCALTGTGVNSQGQKYIQITVGDSDSGLAGQPNGVVVTENNNATMSIPAFTAGTTSPLVVTATKINQSQGAQVALQVTDQAGNVTNCDPVLTDVIRDSHRPTVTTATGIAQSEHLLHIYNGAPGLSHLIITVDGRKIHERDLQPNQQYTIDIAAALQPGSANTVTIIARGKQRGAATIVIADS